jgi:Family of unknown function (DUF5996)
MHFGASDHRSTYVPFLGTRPRLPALPLEEWEATKDTLHLSAQIVGKVRLASTAPRNHWWHVPLYVDVHGLAIRRLHSPKGRPSRSTSTSSTTTSPSVRARERSSRSRSPTEAPTGRVRRSEAGIGLSSNRSGVLSRPSSAPSLPRTRRRERVRNAIAGQLVDGASLRRARSATRSRFCLRALRGSGRPVVRVDESATGSANFCSGPGGGLAPAWLKPSVAGGAP